MSSQANSRSGAPNGANQNQTQIMDGGAVNDLRAPVNALASPYTALEIADTLEKQATTIEERTVAHSLLQQAFEADKRGRALGLSLPGLTADLGGGPTCIDGDALLKSMAANSLKPKPTPVRVNYTLDALGEYTGIQDAATLTSRTMAFLEAVSRTPAVQLIIRTRVAQAQRFCRRSRFKGDIGLGIRQIEERRQLTGAAARERDALEDFVLHGGYRFEPNGQLRRRDFDGQPGVWDGAGQVLAGGLHQTVGIMVRNALGLDWAPVRFEPGGDENAMPVAWFSNADVDAKQIRRTYEHKYVPQIDRSGLPTAFIELEPNSSVSAGMVRREFPWNRMAVMVRNPRTDFFGRGYGFGETESALDLLASMILNLKFRSEYFDNNHIPPAIVTLRGQLAGFNDNSLSALRTQLAMKTGSAGAFFKLLYIGLPPDEKAGLDIHPLRNATGAVNEMEYAHSDYQALMTLLCALFLIDPAEVGFKSDNAGGSTLQEADPESRFEHSQDKGLVPLMTAIADFFNKHIIQFLNPDFELFWHGLDHNQVENDNAIAQARLALGDTPNEVKDQQDRPRELHAKDTVLWAKTSRKFAQTPELTPEEWRDKVDATYEKEFEKKYGDEIDAWSSAWDEPSGNPSMMGTISEEKKDLAAAKAQQSAVADLIAQGHSPEEAKALAKQNAMNAAMGGQPGMGDPNAGDGGPLSQIPQDGGSGAAPGGPGGQPGQSSPFDLDAQSGQPQQATPQQAQPQEEPDEDKDDPYEIEDADEDDRFGVPRSKLNKSFSTVAQLPPAPPSAPPAPRERVIRIVRI